MAYAQPDTVMTHELTPNDSLYAVYQWDLTAPTAGKYGINAQAAWDITTGRSSTVVAVVDTGLLGSHSDLSGRWVAGYDYIWDSVTANDGGGRDSDASDPGDWITAAEDASGFFAGCGVSDSSWHGSHVAGTIGAAGNNGIGIAGVNWAAKILPVRVLGKCGGYTSDIIDGVRWAAGLAVTGVPANPNPAKVLNLSLGGARTCSATWQSAVNHVTAAGAVVVVAAGNAGANASGYSPAGCSGVIAVAATDKAGSRAYYSNYGAVVEISAPGGGGILAGDYIYSTINTGTTTPTGTYSYWGYGGTSMAAPHVAGVVSLMFAVNPGLTPAQVLSALQASATAFPAGSTCSTSICGAGIVNTAQAVALVSPPALFAKSAPSSGAASQPTSLSLSWAASTGAVSYNYCYDTTNNSTCDGSWVNTTATSASISGLSYNAAYYWQVRAVTSYSATDANAAAPGDSAGAWWSFTTQAAPPGAFAKTAPPTRPAAPVLRPLVQNIFIFLPMITSSNGSTSQPTVLTLTWSASTDAVSYEYCYDTTNDSLCAGTWTSAGTAASASISGLSYAATYYWQARAVNTTGTTEADAGTWWSFTTQAAPPAAFSKSSPGSGAAAQPLALTLSWGASTEVSHYEYCVDTTNDNACGAAWTSTASTASAALSVLSPAATYYWQARAVNSTGTTYADSVPGGCDVTLFSFTTQVGP